MDTKTLTEVRFDRREKRDTRTFGLGHTQAGLKVAESYFEVYTELVAGMIGLLKPKAIRDDVNAIGHEKLALAAVSGAIDSIAGNPRTLVAYYSSLGKLVDFERYSYLLHNWDDIKAKELIRITKAGRSSIDVRRKALRSFAQKKGFKCDMWPERTRITVGAWLHSVVCSGPAFTDDGGFPRISPAARGIIADVVEATLLRRPVRLPQKAPIDAWRSGEKVIDGYPISLVRVHGKEAKKVIDAGFKNRTIFQTVESVNHAESVPFRINTPILGLVEWCFENNVTIKKMPPKEDIPTPPHPKPWDEMTEQEQKGWKLEARDAKMENRGFEGQRFMLALDIETAKWLGNDPFYLPMNLDYRGRLYSATSFNFQRGDYVRALFRFACGKPLGSQGLQWLKVHVANTGDFGKVSKKSFAERVAWVEANRSLIFEVAQFPEDNLVWTEADKPFMFVAACRELAQAWWSGEPETFVSDLPISFDGSCSGLQHLAAATRDAKTAYHVNLEERPEPGDIYGVVAGVALKRILDDSLHSEEDADMAHLVLNRLQVDRKLFKRNVMTYCYSSPQAGMSDQHYEDTMRPLQREVMAGRLTEHPFGPDKGSKASRYLGKVGFQSVEQTVQKPAEAMRFLRQVASVLAHEGKPVLWHTPLGFPVLMKCSQTEVSQITLTLHDRGVTRRVSPSMQVYTDRINKHKARNTIAPSFVHSLDACHLHMVVLACKDEGITDLALVHDSFGCLAADADDMRRILKEQFYDLYSNNDVLADILREACEQLHTSWHKLPNVPDRGTYDINDILNAEFAFA